MKNYYAILEVPVGCSLEEIRQAYRRLVQEHLDDEAVFADLKEAYEVLTTPARRADYDRASWGEAFDQPAVPAGGAAAGRCPMGAEAQCPVVQERVAPGDVYCSDCGFRLAALAGEASFDLAAQPDPLQMARLEELGGQTHLLRAGVNLVGREGSDVLLPDKTVSRQHARMEVSPDGTGATLEDLSSTNGTQINDEPLTPHVLRRLTGGDRLRFGSIYATLRLPASESAATPAAQAAPAPAFSAPLLSAPAFSAVPSGDAPGAGGSEFVYVPTRMPEPARARVSEMRAENPRVYPLPPGATTFGRRPENAVVLTGDPYVSGSHARIVADGDVFVLTDTGSTNGTLLNGERLEIDAPVTLTHGDVVLIGGTALRFDLLEPPQESADGEDADGEESGEEDTGRQVPGGASSVAAPGTETRAEG